MVRFQAVAAGCGVVVVLAVWIGSSSNEGPGSVAPVPGTSRQADAPVERGIGEAPAEPISPAQTPQAKATADKATKRSKRVQNLVRKGDDLIEREQFAGALSTFQEALSLDPLQAVAHAGAALAHGHLGNIEQSVAAYRIATSPELAGQLDSQKLAVSYDQLGVGLQARTRTHSPA